MLTSQDLLNIALAVGFLVLVGFFCYVCYYLVETLKSVKKLVDNTEDITSDVRAVKNQIKSGVITGLGTALNLFSTFLNKKRR